MPRKGKAFVAGGSEYLDEPLAASVNKLSFFLRLSHFGSIDPATKYCVGAPGPAHFADLGYHEPQPALFKSNQELWVGNDAAQMDRGIAAICRSLFVCLLS